MIKLKNVASESGLNGFMDEGTELQGELRFRDTFRVDGRVKGRIVSDHTPVDEDAKQLPFGEAQPGATGLELLLPLTLKWAQEAKLPLAQALARVTVEPARVLAIDAGHLSVGANADVCVFDPEAYSRITAEGLKSQGKNTPFLGYELPGVVRATLVSGHLCYEMH